MQQWIAKVAYGNKGVAKVKTESYYLPTADDVRNKVTDNGGYVLTLRAHQRTSMERLLARSTWWQVQLLRGIQFRSNASSPGVALWRIIEAEINPTRQNILSPAREALSKGLSIIDALKSLKIFDHGTMAILAASEKANKLADGIPHAIQAITQKRKNTKAIMGTMAWLGFDVFTIVSSLYFGKDMILDWFRGNPPSDPVEYAKFEIVIGNLELTWDVLIYLAWAITAFMCWAIFSYFMNRGKKDWPTARIVRKIPLIGGYMRDLAFADSMAVASRMLRGDVSINSALEQSADTATIPEVNKYWQDTLDDLSRGVTLGMALDRTPLGRGERIELAGLADLEQVATVMESISEMRAGAAKTKHSLILWLAFGITALYLLIAFGSSIYALSVMNMSMDSMMSGIAQGAL